MVTQKQKSATEIMSDGLDNYDKIIDEEDSTTTYIGETKHKGATVSDAVWRISKITVSGTQTGIFWADGDDGFTKIWDDRTTYTYTSL